jgi:dTMP kinase
VRAINDFATGGLTPDRTLLLELDPAIGRARQGTRLEGFDRLEQEEEAFFATIAQAYSTLADAEPQRVRRIDAGQPAAAVAEQARAAVEDLLPR